MKNIISNDTIIAPITSVTGGSVCVIRISGKDSILLAKKAIGPFDISKNKGNTLCHGYIKNNGNILDEVIIALFRKPKSYTGEDVIEINCHANPFIVNNILQTFLDIGCRYAEPGEFTKRAFLNGKMDLIQAEAVQDIISSQSKLAVNNAISQLKGSLSKKIDFIRNQIINISSFLTLDLDFADGDIEIIEPEKVREEIEILIRSIEELAISYNAGKKFSNPMEVVIAGKPNVGKSSLMNALLEQERVIVSEIPGTTRDYIHEEIIIKDIIVKFIDTAGIRITENSIEIKGIEKTIKLFSRARLILLMLDLSQEPNKEDKNILKFISKRFSDKLLIIGNKKDLNISEEMRIFLENVRIKKINISAKKIQGINILKEEIYKIHQEDSKTGLEEIFITNERQYTKLIETKTSLKKVLDALANGLGYEFLAVDLKSAIDKISEITGEIATDDILNNIFKNFCIGK
ncbi:MAG: tRNA uridine-5-carboxymethylaminomethyl(34) synthesis GTPase MnmE [Calditrichaeota bacterium]|nr:MAG: tRNA uridine-5-carboxymethylaminomethyl(34) synthesis GTPase MnmE [Calditrichota bacterium]